MNTKNIVEFTNKITNEEELIKIMYEEKKNEFIKHQDSIQNKLEQLIKDYFPKEVIELIKEYINYVHRYISINDLWIGATATQMEIKLHPNKYQANVIYCSNGVCRLDFLEKFNYVGNDIDDAIKNLELSINKFKDYELLLQKLQEEIENIYDMLADWKAEKICNQMEFLKSIK